MESKTRIKNILKDKPVDRVGFWLGNPTDETKRIYYEHFGIKDDSEQLCPANAVFLKDIRLHLEFNSDLFWASPELDVASWIHPEGKVVFDVLGGKKEKALARKEYSQTQKVPVKSKLLTGPIRIIGIFQ